MNLSSLRLAMGPVNDVANKLADNNFEREYCEEWSKMQEVLCQSAARSTGPFGSSAGRVFITVGHFLFLRCRVHLPLTGPGFYRLDWSCVAAVEGFCMWDYSDTVPSGYPFTEGGEA